MSVRMLWMKDVLLPGGSLAVSFVSASVSVVFPEGWCGLQ